ncbi:MAG: hypothetical protein KBD50_01045 [Candidatus Pacebacteria bacterium]|nr:hypothetical protein [Candidatus Paceibacterota bacterium]
MNTKKIVSTFALASLLLAGAASAQTTTPEVTTPGVPETGAGGNTAANILLLSAAAGIALVGGTYLTRKGVRE